MRTRNMAFDSSLPQAKPGALQSFTVGIVRDNLKSALKSG